MQNQKKFKVLAFDLGASSGRATLGILDDNNLLELKEIYRFPNSGVKLFNSYYWDILNVISELQNSLIQYARNYNNDGSSLISIGIDTWGVDFVLLNERDDLAGFVHHYRDKRTQGILDKMFKIVSKKEIFYKTGIQFLELNTSAQLFSMVNSKAPELSITKSLLMFPDYLNFYLSGVKSTEYSIASTTQLYNPIKKQWDFDLISKLGLDVNWFYNIIPPGTILGNLRKTIADEIGLDEKIKIIAPLCHDTGSAIAAVPVDMKKYCSGEWAYLSSGTWSLIGIESNEPIITEKALNYNFTNEGGINGTIRFLKNITGLWILQECKKIWDRQNSSLTWEKIIEEAEKAPPFKYFINPDDIIFLNPDNMIKANCEFCEKHNQKSPKSIGEITRTILESLAFKYRQAIENLVDITRKKLKILYIIGGGSENSVLNQFTSNALNLPVMAGPSEASTIGNILVQALANGRIKNVGELRDIVKNSFSIKEYSPKNTNLWNEAFGYYLDCIK